MLVVDPGMRIPVVLVFMACVTVSCNGVRSVKRVFHSKDPEAYAPAIEVFTLDKNRLARLWEFAGERSLHDSIMVLLPYGEAGYFSASEPDARSYSFVVKEGQVLTIEGSCNDLSASRTSLDLFVKRRDHWESLAHTEASLSMSYEFTRSDTCLLRLRPELLSDVYYTIGISLTPVLINPVAGATNKSIGSFYGASRDRGQRSHEGVDIFAKKGTPVVAPTDGRISKVSTSKLGGKVIWFQDAKRGHVYYFAHLDRQLVKAGAKVAQGDTIGTVGNTGNARNTASHLHFGIYQTKSKDPIDYIRTLERIANALPWDTTLSRREFKVGDNTTPFRQRPDDKGFVREMLQKDTYVKVVAQTMRAYRVRLPDGREGFVDEHMLTPLEGGRKIRVKSSKTVYRDLAHSTPVAYLDPSAIVHVLAHFKSHKYVITEEGITGWLLL